jgi:hypothetical protein
MKKLFYRLASGGSLAKLFSMDAQLKERKRVMFFAVLAFLAFVSLGAFVFPQVGHAQCIWDCDLGSDTLDNPWGNSPQALDIVYCVDRDCVLNLEDGNGNPIFTGNNIPTPKVLQTLVSNTCPGTTDVTISGNVVALLRNQKTGNLDPASAAQASLTILIHGVTCSLSGGKTILSRVLTLDPNVPAGQPRTDVFDGTSSITILPPIPNAWGCPTNGPCSFPLGIVEFKNKNQLSTELPATATFPIIGEVYRAVESNRFIGVRDCKGNANGTAFTIACPAGEILTGGNSLALFTFPGNWAGATGHTINPKSGTNPFTISTDLFASILPETVTASANNGPEVPNSGCNDQASQNSERCSFSAKDLLPNGCTANAPVAVLVRGRLVVDGTEFKFISKDNPTCSK